MTSLMKTQFHTVVNNIFNNWTALQLAIDHGMGGAQSKQIASQFETYMVDLCCTKNNISTEEIEDALLDILEEEFNIICEDNSAKEVSMILFRFLSLLKDGNLEEYEKSLKNLPTRTGTSAAVNNQSENEHAVSEDVGMDAECSRDLEVEQQEEAEGWTTIRSRRKK